jgi:hypothetical protein
LFRNNGNIFQFKSFQSFDKRSFPKDETDYSADEIEGKKKKEKGKKT